MSDGPLAVILAAGQGKRMRSSLPKVLHRLGGRPIIDHVVDTAREVTGRAPLVVINPSQTDVARHLDGRASTAVQAEPRGTGDAVRAVPAADRETGPVLVLNADVPLVTANGLKRLLAALEGHAGALLTVTDPGRNGLGRVQRNADGNVGVIVEERDLVPGAVVPEECNVGIYAFDGARLWPALDKLRSDNAQREFYLTDVVELIEGSVAAVSIDDPDEALGINDRRQLALAEAALRRRTLDGLMLSGVTIIDPATTYVDATVQVGRDSVIHPMTTLRGQTVLGEACEIGPMASLSDVRAGARVVIGSSVIESSELGDDVTIGHFNRVRPDSHLEQGVSLGTHAEVKNSTVGAGSRINHFACVLDADLGKDVNIGAGTVTCNFDGAAKHRTTIGDSVFVGTNSTLVAPLTLADGSYVAAGSLVNQDVPARALAVGRARQRNVEGWVDRRTRSNGS